MPSTAMVSLGPLAALVPLGRVWPRRSGPRAELAVFTSRITGPVRRYQITRRLIARRGRGRRVRPGRDWGSAMEVRLLRQWRRQ